MPPGAQKLTYWGYAVWVDHPAEMQSRRALLGAPPDARDTPSLPVSSLRWHAFSLIFSVLRSLLGALALEGEGKH